ncbi:NUDIX hydrolase [Streptosporangium lutulentum]|uniref:8-oxo-dGTP pyrophosphatase MutT (NUDIX family) n=1 Tax=Streptosporangium lutulentum TaxID=1461250 RepID=A0ABT9QEM2_9ACTN|nr:NUDIX domain-containing protein [Streptosporangium lutulentum]MDP9845216.1 8-oxo-dGTP pyrophosphatase MutT (NUDIX family) [Streptosporangium lutulentum]
MLVDIYTDRNKHIGVEDKKAAHERGLWHRTFSCLVVSPSTQTVLLQKKQPGRYVFDRPDHADFTVGGHYEAGESIADGVREIREELGLDVDYKELQPLGIRQTAVALAPKWIEREFQYWHLLALPLGLEEIPLDDAEVSGLVQIGLDDAIALAAGDRSEAPARYLIRSGDGREYRDATLTREDLVPGYLDEDSDRLYLRLFIAAHRYLQGERDRLFW